MDPINNTAHVVMIDFSNYAKTRIRKSFILPGHWEVKRGEVVNWVSNDSNAIFYFPKPEIFGKKEYKVDKGEVLELTVQENAPEGSFPYAVFTDNQDFAEGGSFPRLIIK